MTNPLVAIRGVTKRYPGVVALDGVSFEVQPGELHAIVGENGAGKSTLMKIIAGAIVADEGELLLRGAPVRFANTREAQAAGVGIIHQELNLVEQLSVAANMFLGREPRGAWGLLDERRMRAESQQHLADLECGARPDELVGRLRVGDQQLVEIARAVSQNAELLIMDEPTSALSETEVARLDRVIARLRQRGVTILYISHKMDEVFRLADQITVLRDGKFVKTLRRGETTPKEITHLMVGREIEATTTDATRRPGEVLLETRGLSLPWRGHARQWRLHEISFQLRAGEVVGVAGLMGAGRTELLECLFGASPEPPLGEILVAGRRVSFRHPADARAAGIALVTEDRKRLGLFGKLSVGRNMTLCQLDAMARLGLVRGGVERRAASEMIGRVGVKTASIDAAITSLSGGNQQKAIIGRWLLTSPRVLLLDDPTRGVDVGAKAELYRLIARLCGEGLGILITSSELPELLTLCDRILVLREGRRTAEFDRQGASEQAIMEAATQGV